MTSGDGAAVRRCGWCSAEAVEDLTHCAACGAALVPAAMADSVVIPGVTHVDAGLQYYAAQPLRVPGVRTAQMGPADMIQVLTGSGGPVIAALGTLAAMAANEYLEGRSERNRVAGAAAIPLPYAAPLAEVRPTGQPAMPGAAPLQASPPETFEQTIKRLDARLAAPEGDVTPPTQPTYPTPPTYPTHPTSPTQPTQPTQPPEG